MEFWKEITHKAKNFEIFLAAKSLSGNGFVALLKIFSQKEEKSWLQVPISIVHYR